MAETNDTAPSPLPTSRRRRWLWAAGIAVALGLIVLILIPHLIRMAAESWLRDQGQVAAKIGDVDFNPFTGRLAVTTLEGRGGENESLDLEEAMVRLEWFPFFFRRLRMEDVSLVGIAIDGRMDEDGTVTIGQLQFTPAESEEEPSAEEKKPWGVGLGNLDLRNVLVRWVDPQIEADILVHELHIDPVESWNPDEATPFRLHLEVNQGELWIDGWMKPFAESPTVEATIRIQGAHTVRFAKILAEKGIRDFDAVLGMDMGVKAEYRTQQEALDVSLDGSISVGKIRGIGPRALLEDATVRWNGKVDAAGPVSSPEVNAVGTLSVSVARGATVPDALSGGLGEFRWEGKVRYGEQIEAEGNLTVSELDVEGAAAEGNLLEGTGVSAFGGKLEVNTEVRAGYKPSDETLHADLDGDISLADIRAKVPEAEILDATIRWHGTIGASGKPARLQVSADGALDVTGLQADTTSPALAVAQESVRWQGSVQHGEDLNAEGNLSTENLRVRDKRNGVDLLHLPTLNLDSIRVEGLDRLKVAELRLGGLRAMERPKEAVGEKEADHTLSLERLTVGGIGVFDRSSVEIGEIEIVGLETWIERDAEGAMEVAQWAESFAGEQPHREESHDAPGDRPSTAVRVGKIELAGDNRVVFHDESVSPPYHLVLAPLELHVENIDTTDPGYPSPVELKSRAGKYSTIELRGHSSLGDPFHSTELTARLESIHLPRVSPYVERHLGYKLLSGELHLDTEAKIQQGTIQAGNDVQIHKLELKVLRPEEKDDLTEELGLPLNTALNLLRDKNDDIKLKIPVEGDVSNPEFGIGDAVRKAVAKGAVKAIKTAAVIYFAPVGAVLAAGKLLDLATAIRFESVAFEPGGDQLSPDAEEYLKKMGPLLRDRPAVRLQLCGVVTPTDVSALQEAAIAEMEAQAAADSPDPSPGEPAGTVPEPDRPAPPEDTTEAAPQEEVETVEAIPPPEIPGEDLFALAERRSEAVKDFLIADGTIDPKRLLICRPELTEQPESTPRVDISL